VARHPLETLADMRGISTPNVACARQAKHSYRQVIKMDFKFGKPAANVCVEQICGRLRQYVRELPDDKSLTIDAFAEQITFCVLRELNEFNLPIDPQKVIAVAIAMLHTCMQTIAVNIPTPPNPSKFIGMKRYIEFMAASTNIASNVDVKLRLKLPFLHAT